MTRRLASLAIALAMTSWSGCKTPAPAQALIQSSSPDDRIRAIVRIGATKDAGAVPLLVDRLEDDDPAVRMLAGQALREITGQDHGWRYYDGPRQRAEAVEHWRSWLRRGRTNPTTQAVAENRGSS